MGPEGIVAAQRELCGYNQREERIKRGDNN
jgi:hypothetical protein